MGERRRALVAGVTSCGGRHLAAALDATAWDVVGTRRPEGAPTDGLPPTLRVATHTAGDSAGLRALLDEVRPSAVYFLLSAGRTDSFETMLAVTVRGVAALCEALLASRARPVVVVASSSAVYGTRSRPERVNESAPRRPTGPYGLGKSIAEEICDYHARRYALPIRIARPFNHPGPGERAGLMAADYARRIVDIERGEAPPHLLVRGAENARDFVDVRDVARGYLRLAECGRDGEAYNFCSGTCTRVREAVAMLEAHARVRIEITHEASSAAPDAQVGDPGKTERELGWTCATPLAHTLRDVLEYERSRR